MQTTLWTRRRWRAPSWILLLGATALLGASPGCEWTDEGQLAMTWRFNGHADERGNSPCLALGADRVVISLDGPQQAAEVVACDNVDPDYPLLWLDFVADLPVKAYGRLLRDLPAGDYAVRVFFIDAQGAELTDPAPQSHTVTVERDQVTRLDLDFPVSTGSLVARWRIGGQTPSPEICAVADASSLHVTVSPDGGGSPVAEATAPCDLAGATLVLPGLPPGDYALAGELRDATGAALTAPVVQTGLTVAEADATRATLAFAWSDFTTDLRGVLRLDLQVDGGACEAVSGLAHPPLAVRLGLRDAGDQPVSGAVAYANPQGASDCTGLSPAITADGTTLAACPATELILCDLPAGQYQVSAAAVDASDLVCYAAEQTVQVAPLPPEAAELLDLTTTDATACWP